MSKKLTVEKVGEEVGLLLSRKEILSLNQNQSIKLSIAAEILMAPELLNGSAMLLMALSIVALVLQGTQAGRLFF